MKIAVVGVGALGTLFGGLLRREGHDVWLLHHRESYAETLRTKGVRIESDVLDDAPVHVSVSATTDADEVGHVDLALVLVKAHQTRTALEDHGACIGPETRVLTLQNGLRCFDTVVDVIGPDRALGGITYQGAVRKGPGVAVHTAAGQTVFGGEDDAFARRLRDVFGSAGIGDVSIVSDPRQPIWEKQLVGAAVKPLGALTRLPNAALVADERLAETIRRLMIEAATVAESQGVDVSPEEQFDGFADFLAESGGGHRSSMLQDVEAERPTEIGAVNGAIVELADEEGIDVPYNRLSTTLVKGLERSYLGEG